MKFIKTELKTTFVNMNSRLPEVVTEAFTHLEGLEELARVLVSEEEYTSKYGEEEYFEEYQLSKLEDYQEIPTPDLLIQMGKNLGAGSAVLNRRLKAFSEYYSKVMILSEDATMCFIPLTDEDREKIRVNVEEAIGNLVSFIFYQFSLDTTLACILDKSELEVDINFYNYVEKKGFSLTETVLRLKELLNKFRPTLPLFEERPELEEPFYNIAGPYVHDFDVLEEFITLADVVMVLENPDLDIEKYVAGLERKAEQHRAN